MPALESEIERCRYHLGYGCIGLGSQPYTDDGFYNVFHDISAPNLTEFEETTVALAITAGVVTVTPASMTGIARHVRMVVDVGDDTETIVVRGAGISTFTARFTKDHAAACPIAVESGLTEMRELIHSLDKEDKAFKSGTVSQAAGIKQVGRGQIEWFGPYAVEVSKARAYKALVGRLSELLRIEPWGDPMAGQTVEVY